MVKEIVNQVQEAQQQIAALPPAQGADQRQKAQDGRAGQRLVQEDGVQLQHVVTEDAIQPSHLLSPPSSPALNLSEHQDLFQ